METSRMIQHNVFIDYSSEDTGYSFVSHLEAALLQLKTNIMVFLADHCTEAPVKTGFLLSEEIQSVIERSKVYVVIFSENYASSSLCLEMLVTFMNLQSRKDGHVVIPVFYGEVTRSIVELQMEKFQEAFT